MTDLDGRRAFVTGGGSGIGAAIALALAEAGATVTIAGRQEPPLAATAARHPAIDYVICDVANAAAVGAMVAEASAHHGPVDIAVASAGAATSRPFARMTAADLDAMLGVNLKGVVHLWQAALPLMTASGSGRLIAIASTAGLKGYPYVSGYCAAKHAVVGLTRALARELAPTGITVNAVCPGYTDTPMLEQTIANIVQKTGRGRDEAKAALKASNPQRRFIRPAEVAAAVVWLAGRDAAAVTGQAISISGGET